jgi:hypothetical protein
MEPEGEISRLRRRYTDRLITPLAVLLALEIFVVAPFHAVGILGLKVSQLLPRWALSLLSLLHHAALAIMSICFAANVGILWPEVRAISKASSVNFIQLPCWRGL